MNRILKLLTLAGALALTAGACADPASRITADDSAAGLDCDGGVLGSGGGRECPPPQPPG